MKSEKSGRAETLLKKLNRLGDEAKDPVEAHRYWQQAEHLVRERKQHRRKLPDQPVGAKQLGLLRLSS